MEFPPDRVAASAEGGIALVWSREGKYANMEFFNSGAVLGAIRGQLGSALAFDVVSDRIEEGLNRIREYVNA